MPLLGQDRDRDVGNVVGVDEGLEDTIDGERDHPASASASQAPSLKF